MYTYTSINEHKHTISLTDHLIWVMLGLFVWMYGLEIDYLHKKHKKKDITT